MATSQRDRPRAAGQRKGDGRIASASREIPKPPMHDEEKVKRRQDVRSDLNEPEDFDLMELVQDAETISRDYHSRVLTRPLATAHRAWRNEHSQHSKYLGPGFKGRSRLFVPKTRMAVRKNMATAAAALFSSDHIANVEAVYEDDPVQLATASVKKELLNYRLGRGWSKTGINWMQMAMGAVQDSQLTGICVSKQYWEYEKVEDGVEEREVDVIDDDSGDFLFTHMMQRPKFKIAKDRPMVELCPIENVSLDPAAPWYDPIGAGSWFFCRYPMYSREAKAMLANSNNEQGFVDPETVDWELGRSEDAERSTTRRTREGGLDRIEQANVGDYEIVWIVERFIRVDGEDLHFWTIGDQELISKVQKCEEAYPALAGERPYVMGVSAIDSHKVVPMSPAESWQPLQLELNDVTNLRQDALKRSISPLAKVKRGKNVDLTALLRRGQPESVIQVDDKDDVDFTPTPPPTQASYTETSVTNSLFDELAGVYSSSSVQSNRQLNETVGGMKLLSGAANAVSEFDLRVWVESWVEPVLRQVSKLIDYYESDLTALSIAGAKAKAWQRYNINPDFDNLIATETNLRVSVGIGGSDPMQRLSKMEAAFAMLAPLFSEASKQGISPNMEEIIAEIFGNAGFKDGRRFFHFDEPEQEPPPPEMIELMEKMKVEGQKLDLAREKMAMESDSDSKDRKLKLLLEQIRTMAGMQAEAQKHSQGIERDVVKSDLESQEHEAERNFQRENKTSDQDFQMATKEADQDFQREGRESDSYEKMVERLSSHFLNGEAQDGAGGAGVPATTAPQQPQPPVPSGNDIQMQAIVSVMEQMMRQNQQAQQESTQVLAQALNHLATAMSAPKQVLYSPEGRPVGVAPGAPSRAIMPPTQKG